MVRLILTVIKNIFNLYYIPYMRYVVSHPEKYDEEERYNIVKRISYLVTRASRVETKYFGQENIPENGNYIICSNHQGKFDALAIVNGHDRPVSLLMDYERSFMLVVNEIMLMLDGKRMSRVDIKQAMGVIIEMTKELKEGRKFIIFPEGGYLKEKHNKIYPFKAGTFKSVQRAKSTIIPVALIDTYKVYGEEKIGRVYNEVHYLEPITPDELEGLNTTDIATMVRMRIANAISEIKEIALDDVLEDIDADTKLI